MAGGHVVVIENTGLKLVTSVAHAAREERERNRGYPEPIARLAIPPE